MSISWCQVEISPWIDATQEIDVAIHCALNSILSDTVSACQCIVLAHHFGIFWLSHVCHAFGEVRAVLRHTPSWSKTPNIRVAKQGW